MATVPMPGGRAQGSHPDTMLDEIAEQVRLLREEVRSIASVMVRKYTPPSAATSQPDAEVRPARPVADPSPELHRSVAPQLRGEAWERHVKQQFTGSRLVRQHPDSAA